MPPGGHIDRDELPRTATRREVREELGLEVGLTSQPTNISTDRVSERPGPKRFLLVDVHAYGDGSIAHQHLDFVYYGRLAAGQISPVDETLSATDRAWFDPGELRSDNRVDPDVSVQGLEAIETEPEAT